MREMIDSSPAGSPWLRAARAVPPAWLCAAAVLGALTAAAGNDGPVGWAIPVGVAVGVVGVVVGAIDVRERRIPNVAVLATLTVTVLLALVAWVFDGRQVFGGLVAGGLVAGTPLMIVHLVSPRGMGFGDVKYGAALGALLGVLGWRLAVVEVMIASLAGGLVGLVYAPWRRSIPFGVFLSVGALVALGAARVQS